MPIHIQAPDGSIAEFPDGTPDTTITAVMAKTFGGPKQGAATVVGKRNLGLLDTVKDAAKQYGSGVLEGAAGFADSVMQASPVGMVKNAFANAANLAELASGSGGPKVTAAPMAAQQAAVTRATPAAQTTAGRYARTVGQMTPNAAAPGSAVRRVANVVLPALGSEAAAQTAETMGGNPFAVGLARTAGAIGGSALASVKVGNPFSSAAEQTPEELAANVFAKRVSTDPAAMRQRAQQMQDAGVEPTLVDVSGDRGRRLIRAVGVKSDDAGEVLADNARSVSSTAKPAIMERTRAVGPFAGKTADEMQADLQSARDEAASTQYRQPYQTPVSVTSETRRALADEPGRQALLQARKAAVARMDDSQVAEIDGLLGAAGNPPTQVSAGTLDRIRIALRERAAAAGKRDQGSYASGLRQRQGMVDQTLDTVPQLQPARADYRAKSQALGVLGRDRQDVFSTDPGTYGKWLQSLSPEARQANQVAIRQEILDTLGGQRASTLGSIDELATSQYARDNLKQALGPQADEYLSHLQARLDQVRNARMVDPNAGSRTAILENDLNGAFQNAKKAVGVGSSVARGDVLGAAGKVAQWFLSRGVSEEQANALARAAVDPKRLPDILSAIERREGRQGVQQFLQLRNAAVIGGASTLATARAAQARQEDSSQR